MPALSVTIEYPTPHAKRAVSVVCPTDTASENTGRCYGLFIKIFVEKCSDVDLPPELDTTF
ncbi:hypothetical protein, partial [Klebsiella pneumoniae]|uniref:hypothetical protein n=1 Tax=Klebsiella pneumoniae TaxID=573 RepID=UPI001A7E0522